ncbi:hypothetical protein UNDYM_0517 [Undibacterium sp. YM2]|uniref:hypothetical protein n=1 Tax=Undibacterium sp. YM2 TaxID=2058625 RepID=UPI001331F1C0|nr:hypothetical protein [Undibacterium sp. YM2]BBB64770.1 hypothetical protein UNDYM_0517 [Undibacterium sp. YM2]
MRMITNEELLVVAGGDLEPDEPIQTVEISSPRMTDQEKADFDNEIGTLIDICTPTDVPDCLEKFLNTIPQSGETTNTDEWNHWVIFGN